VGGNNITPENPILYHKKISSLSLIVYEIAYDNNQIKLNKQKSARPWLILERLCFKKINNPKNNKIIAFINKKIG
jgi:hypothetical protein